MCVCVCVSLSNFRNRGEVDIPAARIAQQSCESIGERTLYDNEQKKLYSKSFMYVTTYVLFKKKER